MYTLIDNHIVDPNTGQILGDVASKYSSLNIDDYDKYVAEGILRRVEPMTATEVFDIDYSDKIAEEKFDGHRCLLYLTAEGNRAFSRRISKKTGFYSENTDQLPHIRDLVVPTELSGTILDGEMLIPIDDCNCRKVQSVLGAKPPKAIEFQLNNGFAFLSAFDIIQYRGVPLEDRPLWERKLYLIKAIKEIASPFIKLAPMYTTEEVLEEITTLDKGLIPYLNVVDNYQGLYKHFTKKGKEGLMIKGIYNPYKFSRTKFFIKMKPHLTFDVIILGFDPPDKIFEGKTLREKGYWNYWECTETKDLIKRQITLKEADRLGYVPVTKYYANNWIGAIRFGVVSDENPQELLEVGSTSGFDEEVRQLLSNNADEYLGKVIEIEAQCIINKETGSLQHPRFLQFRPDKSADMCTFSAHIREVK